MQRRDFLKTAGFGAASLLAAPSFASGFGLAAPKRAIGLELFTLIRELDADVVSTLKKVAALGYQEVESSFSSKPGFYGLKAKEFAALTRDLGLAWKSHVVPRSAFKAPAGAKIPTDAGKPLVLPPMLTLQENGPEAVAVAAEAGVRYLVCASLPPTSLDDVKTSIDVLNRTAMLTQKAGLTLCYHNHDTEFRPMQGQVPYDLLLAQTDAQTVKMELDLAWAVKGGADPVELFRRHPGRFPLWHVKDLSRDHQTLEPVGSGTIDFKRIFAQAQLAGLAHLFVEHDMPTAPFDSITTSLRTLRGLLN
ncbi:MAG: sugar phosphate isomerase/epimerase [Hymenobacter sp.]|nr:sugar phosphate isomerase/epimerase [Hymenobacter sp.]